MISFCSGVKEAIPGIDNGMGLSGKLFLRIPRRSSRLEDALSEANPEACREHSGNGRAGAGYTAACGHCRRMWHSGLREWREAKFGFLFRRVAFQGVVQIKRLLVNFAIQTGKVIAVNGLPSMPRFKSSWARTYKDETCSFIFIQINKLLNYKCFRLHLSVL